MVRANEERASLRKCLCVREQLLECMEGFNSVAAFSTFKCSTLPPLKCDAHASRFTRRAVDVFDFADVTSTALLGRSQLQSHDAVHHSGWHDHDDPFQTCFAFQFKNPYHYVEQLGPYPHPFRITPRRRAAAVLNPESDEAMQHCHQPVLTVRAADRRHSESPLGLFCRSSDISVSITLFIYINTRRDVTHGA